LAKPHFFGKKYTASEQLKTPINMEITIVKPFCDFGHNVFKKQEFWPFLIRILAVSYEKIWHLCLERRVILLDPPFVGSKV